MTTETISVDRSRWDELHRHEAEWQALNRQLDTLNSQVGFEASQHHAEIAEMKNETVRLQMLLNETVEAFDSQTCRDQDNQDRLLHERERNCKALKEDNERLEIVVVANRREREDLEKRIQSQEEERIQAQVLRTQQMAALETQLGEKQRLVEGANSKVEAQSVQIFEQRMELKKQKCKLENNHKYLKSIEKEIVKWETIREQREIELTDAKVRLQASVMETKNSLKLKENLENEIERLQEQLNVSTRGHSVQIEEMRHRLSTFQIDGSQHKEVKDALEFSKKMVNETEKKVTRLNEELDVSKSALKKEEHLRKSLEKKLQQFVLEHSNAHNMTTEDLQIDVDHLRAENLALLQDLEETRKQLACAHENENSQKAQLKRQQAMLEASKFRQDELEKEITGRYKTGKDREQIVSEMIEMRKKMKILEERVRLQASEHMDVNLKLEDSKKTVERLEDSVIDLQSKLDDEKKDKSQLLGNYGKLMELLEGDRKVSKSKPHDYEDEMIHLRSKYRFEKETNAEILKGLSGMQNDISYSKELVRRAEQKCADVRKINADDLKRRKVVATARKKLMEDKEVVASQIEREVREAFLLSKLKSSNPLGHSFDGVVF